MITAKKTKFIARKSVINQTVDLMVLSTVPPAVANTPDCQGHQETAFTADKCSVILLIGRGTAGSHS